MPLLFYWTSWFWSISRSQILFRMRRKTCEAVRSTFSRLIIRGVVLSFWRATKGRPSIDTVDRWALMVVDRPSKILVVSIQDDHIFGTNLVSLNDQTVYLPIISGTLTTILSAGSHLSSVASWSRGRVWWLPSRIWVVVDVEIGLEPVCGFGKLIGSILCSKYQCIIADCRRWYATEDLDLHLICLQFVFLPRDAASTRFGQPGLRVRAWWRILHGQAECTDSWRLRTALHSPSDWPNVAWSRKTASGLLHGSRVGL